MFKKVPSISLVILGTLALANCAQNPDALMTRSEQYEYAVERREAVAELLHVIVQGTGPEVWMKSSDNHRPRPVYCDNTGNRQAFQFKFATGTDDSTGGFRSGADKEKLLEKATVLLEDRGMVVRVEESPKELELYADSSDAHVYLSIGRTGRAHVDVRSSCSSEWTGFSMSYEEYIESEYAEDATKSSAHLAV